MDVQHFRMEQDYGRLKQWQLNRLTLGKGVLCGLKVSIEGDRLCVDPGVAIDGLGREIFVPVRACLGAGAQGEAGCGGRGTPWPAPADGTAFYTLWACYRECSADYQPVLVAECEVREQCAPGTTVETFCFKLTRGLAPLQGDPAWCKRLGVEPIPPRPRSESGPPPDRSAVDFLADAEARGVPGLDEIREALRSRRHRLCEATSGACDDADGDPCVPLAAVLFDDEEPVLLENCLVRPRVYSNAMLLDLVLCLAQRIDECCGQDAAADLMRVQAIDFVHRAGDSEETVASVASPLDVTRVRIGGRTSAIRIRFSQPFAQGANKPTTHGRSDPDFKRHNVRVLPEEVSGEVPYVPGTLEIERPDTVRFDLLPDTPYSRGPLLGWQKGRYRIFLSGNDDPDANRRALVDRAGTPLDGEPIAPADGVISGDGTAAGEFVATFVVG
jgi:hypothetical protein